MSGWLRPDHQRGGFGRPTTFGGKKNETDMEKQSIAPWSVCRRGGNPMSGLLDLLAQPWAVWGAFALAQIADVWTTDRVLRGGGRELNPVVATLMGKLGRGWIAGKLAIAGGAAWYLVEAGHPGLVWAVTAVTGAVAANNARFIR